MADAAENNGLDISSLKVFSLGGSAVGPENVRASNAFGFDSWRVYGMSEHIVVTTGVAGDPFEKRAHTDGKITVRNEVRIVDDDEHDVPVGQIGEVCTLGPRLFVGYVDSELDRSCFLPGGWYKSGDIGVMDAEGYLTIVDRKKDIIIRGGENISAKEIEDILAGMPGVVESAVVAMPDPILSERVCAYILPAPGVSVSLETVGAYFRELGITRQKTPEHVIVLESDFPRTTSGKIKKAELRAELRVERPA
jgi:non-ribosomal peptide synthetase component E (peptide arylation enzyme)